MVGGDQNAPAGCPAGSTGTGFGVATGTPAALATQAGVEFALLPARLACNAGRAGARRRRPERRQHRPARGRGRGPVRNRARTASTTARSDTGDAARFGAPLLLSGTTTAHTTNGATGLALSQYGGGGAYATWLDHRGYVLDYSANAGAAWSGPAAIGLNSNASGVIVTGTGQGRAEIAYTEHSGSAAREYLAPVSYSALAGH